MPVPGRDGLLDFAWPSGVAHLHTPDLSGDLVGVEGLTCGDRDG
ncbi:hypothetical protein [Streptomyces goshikiensis]